MSANTVSGNRIKARYSFHAVLVAMLSEVWDYTKLINAIQADLGAADWKGGDIDSQLGNLKLKRKEGTYSTNEVTKLEYAGKLTLPIQVASWGQAMAKLFKSHGAPSGKLSADVVPETIRDWLDEKFTKPEVAPAAEQAPVNRGNGDVKNVPALQPAGKA